MTGASTDHMVIYLPRCTESWVEKTWTARVRPFQRTNVRRLIPIPSIRNPPPLPAGWGCALSRELAHALFRPQVCSLSSQASRPAGNDGGEERKVRRTEEEAKKVAAHKAAQIEYKMKMTALRKEVQQQVRKTSSLASPNAPSFTLAKSRQP